MNGQSGKLKFFWVLGVALLAVMWSCYPGGPETNAETDVAVTYYDNQFNFASVRTYAMPNEVFLREGSESVDISLNGHVLAEVARNMAQLGYVREANPEQNRPDVVMVVSVSRNTTTWVGWVPGYPGYPWWGWWPGWGVWYPWPVVSSYTSGTLFMEMIDVSDIDQGSEQLPARWAGVINGAVGAVGSVTPDRLTRDIDQCFAQSSYLGTR
jgi:hypothetical protein